MGNWDLMMKNVYSLGATTTQKDKFKLDIQYQSDSAGVYVSYIPEAKYKNTKLLRVMNLDLWMPTTVRIRTDSSTMWKDTPSIKDASTSP